MSKVKALVLTGYGLNCDQETAYAFRLAGAEADIVHINSLVDGSVSLSPYGIMTFIGGFSWGDDHGGGVVQAVRMKTKIGGQISSFIENGRLVLGICNGFQALVNLGLLPGFDRNDETRSLAITYNDCGNFRDQWVNLKIHNDSPCIFTRGMTQIEIPVRHGEGKFVAEQSVLDQLQENNQIVMQYALPDGTEANGEFPHNPNGAMLDIAGICDPTGRIFGLMPHPEAYNHHTNHPDWTRKREILRREGKQNPADLTPGIRIFKNAVDHLL